MLKSFNNLGHQKNAFDRGANKWHPWIFLATPLAWKPDSKDKSLVDHEINYLLPEVDALIRQDFKVFKDSLLLRICPPEKLEYFKDGMDDFIVQYLPHLKIKWEKLRRQL